MATVDHGNGNEFSSAQKFELSSLLYPFRAFESPAEVLNDPDLTRNEKRAILASWASDACAIEEARGLRAAPGGKAATFDEIVDALKQLDRKTSPAMRRLDRSSIFSRRARAITGATTPWRPNPPEPPRAA